MKISHLHHSSGWILRKLECLRTEESQLQWRERILVIFETWAFDQIQNFNLCSYRIRSNLWVHGPIGACYPARDSKVETSSNFYSLSNSAQALVTSYHFILLLSLRLPSAGGVYSPGYAFAETTLVSRFWVFLFNIIHFLHQIIITDSFFLPKYFLFYFRLNKKDVTFTSVVEDIWSNQCDFEIKHLFLAKYIIHDWWIFSYFFAKWTRWIMSASFFNSRWGRPYET